MAQERRREGAAVSGEIGLPLPIIVNIMRADRRAGRWDAGRGGAAWESAAKTHPLRPKLHLIYMFTLLNLSQEKSLPFSSSSGKKNLLFQRKVALAFVLW